MGCPGWTLLSTASHIIMAFTSSLELEEITRSGFSARLSTTSSRRCSVSNFFTAASYENVVVPCGVFIRNTGGGDCCIGCLPATPDGEGVSFCVKCLP